jgi:hypothetical protein
MNEGRKEGEKEWDRKSQPFLQISLTEKGPVIQGYLNQSLKS